jgi:hypothetical protein
VSASTCRYAGPDLPLTPRPRLSLPCPRLRLEVRCALARPRRLRVALRWQALSFHNPLVAWARRALWRLRGDPAASTHLSAAAHRLARVDRLAARLAQETRRLAAAADETDPTH